MTTIASVEIVLASGLYELSRARHLVRAVCGGALPALDEDQVAELELAVTEALSNIITHAHRDLDGADVEMRVMVNVKDVQVRLVHAGVPLDLATVRDPEFDGSQDSGFGIYIIRRTADALVYGREGSRHTVVLTKRRKRGGPNPNREERPWKPPSALRRESYTRRPCA